MIDVVMPVVRTELPVDEDKFLSELNRRIETSTFVKKEVTGKTVDASSTYTKS